MQLVNSAGKFLLQKRMRQIRNFKENPEDVQQKCLNYLISTAKFTDYGKKFDFKSITNIRQFQDQVPLASYEDFLPYIKQTLKGEQNILWPSYIKDFAKSSGTTSENSKLIPVSRESLQNCHYQGGRDMLALYLHHNPDSKLFSGKNLSIGGSQESSLSNINSEAYIANISAIVMKNLPFWAQFGRTPGLEITMMQSWEEKIKRMCEVTTKQNVTSMAGSPMWVILLLQHILKEKKVNYLQEIWPNLEVFFHGSVSFTPYKSLFNQLDRDKNLHYLEVYNASEGFFGLQDRLDDPSLLLMLNYSIFYEFIPVEEFNSVDPKVIPLSEVESGKHYSMVITTNSGLWRYKIGDTIQFTETRPYRFIISGRTKQCLNVFGEDIFIYHAEKALEKACDMTGALMENFTAAPRFFDKRTKGYHEWVIEFVKRPNHLHQFTSILDEELCKLSADYKSKRNRDSAIERPVIYEVPTGTFYSWLKKKNKLGGQHKIPRLSNDRGFVEELLGSNPVLPDL